MKRIVVLTCSIIGIFLAGCGPTSEELAITMVAQTDVANILTSVAMPSETPTNTMMPMDTPLPTDTPTPKETPSPVELTEPKEWLVTQADLEKMYGEFSWIDVQPYSSEAKDCMLFTFQSWSINPDNIINCVYPANQDVTIEYLVEYFTYSGLITEESIELQSDYTYDYPFMLYGTTLGDGHSEYGGYLYAHQHVFYLSYDTGTPVGNTVETLFSEEIDKLIYDILMLNLEKSNLRD